MKLLEAILWPFSLPFEAAVRLRSAAYRRGLLRRHRLRGTVVSVGNLTTGGTGKTPLVLALAGHLIARERKVGILSRGYRGRDGTSDEVALLRARLGPACLFGVGADRVAEGSRLERAGAEWILLDDGFQHLRLARDADIVLLDATNPFGGGRLLPSGRLREPKSALSRADLVVLTRGAHAPAVEAVVRHYSRAAIFYAATRLEQIFRFENGNGSEPLKDPRGMKFFAFAGIGNPAAFFADLRNWGVSTTGERAFRDHHRFSAEDLKSLERLALSSGANALICTEKDTFNLGAHRTAALPVFFCRISLELSDEAGFWTALHEVVARNREQARR